MNSALEPLCVEELRAAVSQGLEPDFLFFWSHTSSADHVGKECLSQWYPSPFGAAGLTFPTAEHYMMHGKALLFGDSDTAARILEARHPGEAKELGRHVRGFDEERWVAARLPIVVAGNTQKFAQNASLLRFLLHTKRRVLVEASPRDAIWGIGLGEKDVEARDVDRWRGLNLLGFALMRVRRELRDVDDEAG